MAPHNTKDGCVCSAGTATDNTTFQTLPNNNCMLWLISNLNEFNRLNQEIREDQGKRFEREFERKHLCKTEINNEDKNLEIIFDIEGYEKEDLKVSVKGQTLKLEGRRKETSDDGSQYVSKEFSRYHKLPSNCNAENISSKYLDDGKLVVTIPKEEHQLTNDELNGKQKTNEVELGNPKGPGKQEIRATSKLSDDKSDTTKADKHVEESEKHDASTEQKEDSAGTGKNNNNESGDKGKWIAFNPYWFHPIRLLDMEDISSSGRGWFDYIGRPYERNEFKYDGQMTEDDKECKITFDLEGYKPEELNVSVSDNILKVEGEHEEKDDGDKKYISRKFTRSYVLPKECKVNEAQSHFAKSNQLTITVPKEKLNAEEPKVITVPIKMEEN